MKSLRRNVVLLIQSDGVGRRKRDGRDKRESDVSQAEGGRCGYEWRGNGQTGWWWDVERGTIDGQAGGGERRGAPEGERASKALALQKDKKDQGGGSQAEAKDSQAPGKRAVQGIHRRRCGWCESDYGGDEGDEGRVSFFLLWYFGLYFWPLTDEWCQRSLLLACQRASGPRGHRG